MLERSTPKNTADNTKQGIKLFSDWQRGRQNKDAMTETCGFGEVEQTSIKPLIE